MPRSWASPLENQIRKRVGRLLELDPSLAPYRSRLAGRARRLMETEARLRSQHPRLAEFACGHLYFGVHRDPQGWVLREWAPNARRITLVGDMNQWRASAAFDFHPIGTQGVWELRLPAACLHHGQRFRLHLEWHGGGGERLPAWARRVVQDPASQLFNAEVWDPPHPYRWRHPSPARPAAALIYEAHVGMAQQAERVGTYAEFTLHILPRIAASGYNTIQLMAIQEHPYYGSFGYHVGSFFAASSRFGTPEELKELVDTAHGLGLRVVMDLVHSHTVSNHVEGIGCFDGTPNQYCHDGPRGYHPAWDSRLFDYGKDAVCHFLLSNCRFWLDEYRVDGFRFDGITSMLFEHHGLNRVFGGYEDYFDASVDDDALVYLALANTVIHQLRPDAVTIAEDVSGMPGLAVGVDKGGCGFDYRFAMGVPDYWIRLVKDTPDEAWPMGHLWFELTNRRRHEASISYAESHDQALVGDQTLIFRLMGSDMYRHMAIGSRSLVVERGMALHKLIRLVTLASAGAGYLAFMGNEFGHPDWIDFPRAGNDWSYFYARRQWHLAQDPNLRFGQLERFDRDMLALANRERLLLGGEPELLWAHESDKVLAFQRGELVVVVNFHPWRSHVDYRLPVAPGCYDLLFDSDAAAYGGHDRIAPGQRFFSQPEHEGHWLSLYLPCRSALVLRRGERAR
jgi:1,4-alpha-glucan branching enzyme